MSYRIVPLDASGNYFEVQSDLKSAAPVWWTAFYKNNDWHIVSQYGKTLSPHGKRHKQIVEALRAAHANGHSGK